jgi:hypothetical protein
MWARRFAFDKPCVAGPQSEPTGWLRRPAPQTSAPFQLVVTGDLDLKWRARQESNLRPPA